VEESGGTVFAGCAEGLEFEVFVDEVPEHPARLTIKSKDNMTDNNTRLPTILLLKQNSNGLTILSNN
jgi:hypothetical protein